MTYESPHFTLVKIPIIMIVSKLFIQCEFSYAFSKLFVDQHINIIRHVIDQNIHMKPWSFRCDLDFSMTKKKQLSLN
jgi:hypothetical protein